MPTPLRVLILEDRPADVELIVYELCKAGFAPEWCCVSTESDYLATLDTPRRTLSALIASFPLFGRERELDASLESEAER